MGLFSEEYLAWVMSSAQTKDELEHYIECETRSLDNPILTLREELHTRESVEYAKFRLETESYKKLPDWSPVHFDFPDLVGEDLPPDGYWVLWKTKNDQQFMARYKQDVYDHFYPGAEHSIEDVVGWKWFYARSK